MTVIDLSPTRPRGTPVSFAARRHAPADPVSTVTDAFDGVPELYPALLAPEALTLADDETVGPAAVREARCATR
jgi:hypothetical protein